MNQNITAKVSVSSREDKHSLGAEAPGWIGTLKTSAPVGFSWRAGLKHLVLSETQISLFTAAVLKCRMNDVTFVSFSRQDDQEFLTQLVKMTDPAHIQK